MLIQMKACLRWQGTFVAVPTACQLHCRTLHPAADCHVMSESQGATMAAGAAGVEPLYPTVIEAEFKRPTLLPAKLQCTWRAASSEAASSAAQTTGGLQFAVLTEDGQKEVLVGKWSSLGRATLS